MALLGVTLNPLGYLPSFTSVSKGTGSWGLGGAGLGALVVGPRQALWEEVAVLCVSACAHPELTSKPPRGAHAPRVWASSLRTAARSCLSDVCVMEGVSAAIGPQRRGSPLNSFISILPGSHRHHRGLPPGPVSGGGQAV